MSYVLGETACSTQSILIVAQWSLVYENSEYVIPDENRWQTGSTIYGCAPLGYELVTVDTEEENEFLRNYIDA